MFLKQIYALFKLKIDNYVYILNKINVSILWFIMMNLFSLFIFLSVARHNSNFSKSLFLYFNFFSSFLRYFSSIFYKSWIIIQFLNLFHISILSDVIILKINSLLILVFILRHLSTLVKLNLILFLNSLVIYSCLFIFKILNKCQILLLQKKI